MEQDISMKYQVKKMKQILYFARVYINNGLSVP